MNAAREQRPSKPSMILAGDIGGTSTRLGLFEVRHKRLEPVRTEVFQSRDYRGLSQIVLAFWGSECPGVESACFGIAGPVVKGRVAGPNLAWETHDQTLSRELSIRSVKLINDLEANAHGIPALKAEDLVTLQEGDPNARGNRAVISVGTGLGEAGLFWDGRTHIPFACEGGHADFAPRDDLEAELLSYLRAKFGRVSYERVLSGKGQLLLYEFLRDVKGRQENPKVAAEMQSGDASAVISRAGLAEACDLCVEALNWYVSLYGAETGNLALKMMATGGMYLGGGVAPKIIRKLQEDAFRAAFLTKGRMQPLLESIPIQVIMNDKTALLGAARVAARINSVAAE